MKEKNVIFVVGSKGGGGKTPIALTFGLTPFYYLNKRVAFVDLGYINPDLRRICLNMLVHHKPQDVLVREIIYTHNKTKKALEVYKIASEGTLFLVSRAEQNLYHALSLKEISEIINAVIATLNVDFIVIDTNLSILNFESNFPLLNGATLYFANVWSLSLTSSELNGLYRTKIQNILRINRMKEEHLIHIFSPRFIPGEQRGFGATLLTLLKHKSEIQGEQFFSLRNLLDVYKNKFRGKWVPLRYTEVLEIINEVHKYFIGFRGGAASQSGRDMVDYLFQVLTDKFTHWDYFPMNLIVNPVVRERLAYFSELFSNTLIYKHHIESFLNEDVPVIKDFLITAISEKHLFDGLA